ncbi:MAG TPA: cyclopropane-fatty-acyl-phospholipid synthase family protein [Ktedonobacterales bacterium]|jgi:cyclopropane-fatty-acyl-phospholipid synthase
MTQTPVREIPPAPSINSPKALSQSILTAIFGPPERRNFAVRYWDGTTEKGGTASAFTLILRRPDALRRMFLPPSELALGEAYLRDDYDIEGDMEAAAGLSEAIGNRLRSLRLLAHLARQLMALPAPRTSRGSSPGTRSPQLSGARHSSERDARAVRYHYDVGNDFYALWLDANMVYSCAYFPTGTEDLDAAQVAKMEHICRKLRLKPGERLLDIGCGWGGLIRYAAERYGVQALGVTLSEPQAEWARARIAAAGMEDRCRVEVRDYRTLSSEAPFDKVVSVGMFEHVGRAQLPTYFATAYRVLRPGGLFLNHGIAGSFGGPAKSLGQWAFNRLWKPGQFIWKYVFPDGELVPPREAITQGELAGFETRDVENLREHYVLTLRQWVRRLEARHGEATALVGEPTYRVWRLYMAASAYSFAVGRNSLIQALFSKPGPQGASDLPLTRADLYR